MDARKEENRQGNRRKTRILMVDGHPIVREGLRRIIELEEDLLVCAEADTLRGARSAIQDTAPDVIIADISLNQGDGIGLVRDVRAHYPHLRILVLSIHDEAIYAERMLSIGAHGYMTKEATGEQILRSLRRVIDGGICVTPELDSNRCAAANPIDRLSNRELQVLHLVGKGMSTREAARSLNLSVKTVESHRQRMKAKLNLRNAAQLVRFAITCAAPVSLPR